MMLQTIAVSLIFGFAVLPAACPGYIFHAVIISAMEKR